MDRLYRGVRLYTPRTAEPYLMLDTRTMDQWLDDIEQEMADTLATELFADLARERYWDALQAGIDDGTIDPDEVC